VGVCMFRLVFLSLYFVWCGFLALRFKHIEVYMNDTKNAK
jgi:hypothetical protein